MAGEFEVAREQYRHGRALLDELGGGVLGAFATIAAARVELLAHQPERAVQELRPTFESLAAIGERYFRPLIGALLATSLLALGASNEAAEVAAITETLADPDDTETQMLLRCVGARLARDAGKPDRAVALARDAVEIMRAADAPVMLGDALIVLSETLRDAGATVEADSAQAEALALYVRKGASTEATGLSLRAQPA
jgi:hypothetical protein